MVPLTELTRLVVEKLFVDEDQEMAIWPLGHECADNLPFHKGSAHPLRNTWSGLSGSSIRNLRQLS